MLNAELVIFGEDCKTVTEQAIELILLTAKYFVYKCKINKTIPTVPNFQQDLKRQYILEKYTHAMEVCLEEFNLK